MDRQGNRIGRRTVINSDNAAAAIPSTSSGQVTTVEQPETNSYASYRNKFIQFGFIIVTEKVDLPKCVICGKVLSVSSLKCKSLLTHLVTEHSCYKNKSPSYFLERSNELKEREDNSLMFSYLVSLHIAKCKESYSIVETLLKPCIKQICRDLFGQEYERKIDSIPLTEPILRSRIIDMSNDIESQLVEKLRISRYYAILIDEWLDKSNNVTLLIYVRFLNTISKDVQEEFLCCLSFTKWITSEEIFRHINSYFEKNNIPWSNCVGICTDAAAVKTGDQSDLITKMKNVAHPDVKVTHSFLHWEQFVADDMDKILLEAFRQCETVINYIRDRHNDPNLRQLFLASPKVWTARSEQLKLLIKFQTRIEQFLRTQKSSLSKYFEDRFWLAKVKYLADVSSIMNDFNTSIAEENINFCDYFNKVDCFITQIRDLSNNIKKNYPELFCSLSETVNNEILAHERIQIRRLIYSQLLRLEQFFIRYSSCGGICLNNKWITNPFVHNHSATLTTFEKTVLTKMSQDKTLRVVFERDKEHLLQFWLKVGGDYQILSEKAVKFLLLFVTTHLAETGFSTFLSISHKFQNPVEISSIIRLSITKTVGIRFDKLIEKKNQKPSI